MLISKTKEDFKTPFLISSIGPKYFGILRNLVFPEEVDQVPFDELCKILLKHFKPKINIIYERFVFQKMDQKSGEAISKYIIRLKEQAQRCNFGDFLQESLRDRFVAGIIDTPTQKKLLQEEGLTFEGALDIALSAESADKDLHNLKRSEDAHRSPQHLHAINNPCKHCDFLSRFPEFQEDNLEYNDGSGEILLLNTSIIDHVLVAHEIQLDRTLFKLYKIIETGELPSSPNDDLIPYLKRIDDFTILQECIFLENRMVIPKSLHKRVLQILHESHAGTNKMKMMARSSIWWPGMDSSIEIITKNCRTCLSNESLPPQRTESWPKYAGPWRRVHMDYINFKNKLFLLAVDSFSSWVEVSEVPSTSAYFCINFMRNCIARYGFPQVVVSDNGPPFFSSDFGDFLSKNGISHVTSPPYHPQSNGQAEVSVREVKKLLKKQLYENEQVELNLALSRALFFIRTDVNIRKGTSPAELFLGRKIRSRLSVLSKEEVKASKFNSQYVNSKFKVDETVKFRWITNGHPSWYTGKIIEILGRNVYLIKQGDSIKKVHQNYIRKMLPGKSHPTNMNDAERVPTPISEKKSITTPSGDEYKGRRHNSGRRKSKRTMMNIEQFNPNNGNEISSYLERFESYCIANDIVKIVKKKATFFSLCGRETYNIIRTLTSPKNPLETEWEELVTRIKKYFDPTPNIIVQRFKFTKRLQMPNETISEFITALKKIAEKCEFPDVEDRLRDALVCGILNEEIQSMLLMNSMLTFKVAQEMALAHEAAVKNVAEIKNGKPQEEINVMGRAVKVRRRNEKIFKCFRCGYTNHREEQCFFKDKRCFKCQKLGHISRVCKNGNWRSDRNNNCSIDEEAEATNGLFNINQVKDTSNMRNYMVKVRTSGRDMNMLIDSGTRKNIISEKTYIRTWVKSERPRIEKDYTKLVQWNRQRLSILGKIKADVKVNKRSITMEFLVIEGPGPNLIGREAFDQIGIGLEWMNYGDSVCQINEVMNGNGMAAAMNGNGMAAAMNGTANGMMSGANGMGAGYMNGGEGMY
ncbi:K02A2.6-like, partial [Cordylochernes scorpioides]